MPPQPLPSRRDDRRRNFRLDINLGLRLRSRPTAYADNVGDLVDSYENLGRSALRFRKEASSAGRQFVDQLMGVLDHLTALATEQSTVGGWSPRMMVEANLSAGGLGFAGTTEYPIGTTLGVEFALPAEITAVPFRCRATVVRCNSEGVGQYDIGLIFEELTSVSQERLIRILFDVQRRRLRNRRGRG